MIRSPSVDKLKALGYQPKVDLRTGLRNTYDWYKAHRVKLD
jgi:nucleoside-diphosphate-sugar epimerase